MPSRYEPCGLNQMFSLRYGTIPVVRRTGGLADSVRQFDPGSGEGHRFRLRALHSGRPALGTARPPCAPTDAAPPRGGVWSQTPCNRISPGSARPERYVELYHLASRSVESRGRRVAMHVLFVEPAFPAQPATSSSRGCTRSGPGSPASASDLRRSHSTPSSARGSTVTSRSDPSVHEEALAGRGAPLPAPLVGRPPRGDGRGPRDAHGAGARVLRHPRDQRSHRISLPGQAGDERGAARGRNRLRAVRGVESPAQEAGLHRPDRVPGDPQAPRCRRGRGHLPDRRCAEELARAISRFRLDRGAPAAVEEFIEGHEGFYDTICVGGGWSTSSRPTTTPTSWRRCANAGSPRSSSTTNRLDAEGYDEVDGWV